MITRGPTGDQASRLAHRPRHANLALGLLVWTAGLELPHERIGDTGLAEAAEIARLLERKNGHDARQDWDGYAGGTGPRDEAEVVFVIQEELGGHEIRSRRDLAGEETDV